MRRYVSSGGGNGDGEGEGDVEGWVIQLLSITEGTVDCGRVDGGRLFARVVMVLEEQTEGDLVGDRFMVACMFSFAAGMYRG